MVSIKKYIFTLFLCLYSQANAEYYLKGGVGLNNIKTAKFSNHDFEGRIKLSDSFPLIETGVGYKFDNGIRLEGVIDYYFLFRTLETSIDENADIYKILGKTKADSLMFNIYKDITTIGNFTPFVGGGVGLVYLKESGSGFITYQEDNITIPLDKGGNSKRKTFTYKLTLGTDIKLSDTITGEISYNYFNLGHSKRKLIGGIANICNRNYEVHNITVGMRFAL